MFAIYMAYKDLIYWIYKKYFNPKKKEKEQEIQKRGDPVGQ